MIRERRYIVLKYTDIDACLTQEQHDQLDDICRAVNRHRLLAEKQPVQCVVVEEDWPEYEPVWNMIGQRVDQTNITGDS
jgi:hypothetical protein